MQCLGLPRVGGPHDLGEIIKLCVTIFSLVTGNNNTTYFTGLLCEDLVKSWINKCFRVLVKIAVASLNLQTPISIKKEVRIYGL